MPASLASAYREFEGALARNVAFGATQPEVIVVFDELVRSAAYGNPVVVPRDAFGWHLRNRVGESRSAMELNMAATRVIEEPRRDPTVGRRYFGV